MGIKHAYQSATANNPSDEVSSARWNEEHAVDVSLDLPDNTTDPVAPGSGLKLYSKTRAGRRMPHFIGPSGVDSALQSALFGNRVMLWTPGTGSSFSALGLTPTSAAATVSHPTLSTSSIAESIYRTRHQTSTTVGNAAGLRDSTATIWRGNAAGRGGFFLHHRFCSGTIAGASAGQFINGLSSSTAALAAEPSALTDVLGVGKDIADTNWQFMRRQGSNAVVKTNLGVAYGINQAFDLVMFCAPNSSEIFVTVRQHNFDGTFTTLLDTSYNTSIPLNNTFLARRHQVRNGASALAMNFEMVRSYVESDY